MHDCIFFRSKEWIERQPVIKFHIKPDGKPKGWYDGCEVFIHRESQNRVANGESWHCQLIEHWEKAI